MDDDKTGLYPIQNRERPINMGVHRVESCGDRCEASKGDLEWSGL
jgi:hypothetical protein